MAASGIYPLYSSSRSYGSLLWSLALLVLFAALSLGLYYGLFTGYAGLSLATPQLVAGELLTGTITYDLRTGPLPLDTQVTLFVNGYAKSLPLRTLVSADFISEHSGPIVFAPPLEVTVELREETSGGGSDGSDPITPTDPPNAGPPATSSAVAPLADYRVYHLRAGEIISDVIPVQHRAFIYEVRLEGSDRLIPSSSVSLTQSGTSLSLSTSYVHLLTGFSEETGIDSVSLNLDAFALRLSQHTPPSALVAVVFQYDEGVFVTLEEDRPVSRTTLLPGFLPNVDDPLGSLDEQPVGPSSVPSSEEGSASCLAPACTTYGSCSIPPLPQSGGHVLTSSFVRTRQCLCEDGSSYVESESCTSGEERFDVLSDIESYEPSDLDPPVEGDRIPLMPSTGRDLTPRSWETTYRFSQQDLAISGSVARALVEGERLALPVGDVSHSVGVVALDRSGEVPRALIEVASTPQQFYLALGATALVDVDQDTFDDLAITFVSLSDARAVLRVSPLDLPSLSSFVQEGERSATVVSLPESLPVAYVILNNDLPSLRVFFLQSPAVLPSACFNSIQDREENGVDCGGACRACAVEQPSYAPLISWLVVCLLFFALALITRARRQPLTP